MHQGSYCRPRDRAKVECQAQQHYQSAIGPATSYDKYNIILWHAQMRSDGPQASSPRSSSGSWAVDMPLYREPLSMGKLEHFKFQHDTLEGKNVGEARTAGSRLLTAKSGPAGPACSWCPANAQGWIGGCKSAANPMLAWLAYIEEIMVCSDKTWTRQPWT